MPWRAGDARFLRAIPASRSRLGTEAGSPAPDGLIVRLARRALIQRGSDVGGGARTVNGIGPDAAGPDRSPGSFGARSTRL
jgi:hypothetical protein